MSDVSYVKDDDAAGDRCGRRLLVLVVALVDDYAGRPVRIHAFEKIWKSTLDTTTIR